MILVMLIACVVAGGLLNLVLKLNVNTVLTLAKTYVAISVITSVSYWILYFTGIKNPVLIAGLTEALKYAALLADVMTGYLIVNVFIRTQVPVFSLLTGKIINATLWGITVITGNVFIIATAGKLYNLGQMLDFFKTSGYADWFLYFIMAVEPLGGIGILLHFKLKTGVFATIGLILIMLGAVYTHWHNNDPFSDSYEAVAQLIMLPMLLSLYYLQKKTSHAAEIDEPITTIPTT